MTLLAWLACISAPESSAEPTNVAPLPEPTAAVLPTREDRSMKVEIKSTADFAAAMSAYGKATRLEVVVAPGSYAGAGLSLADPLLGGPDELLVSATGAVLRGGQWSFAATRLTVEGLRVEGGSLTVSAKEQLDLRRVALVSAKGAEGGGSIGGGIRLGGGSPGARAAITDSWVLAEVPDAVGLQLADGPGDRWSAVVLQNVVVAGFGTNGLRGKFERAERVVEQPGPPKAEWLAAARAGEAPK